MAYQGKTSLEMVDDVFALVDVAALKSAITGNIYKYHKPLNSKKINVVVDALTLDTQPWQSGVVNVNIHAANLPSVTTEGVSDPNFPNSVLLSNLAKIAVGLLDEVYKEGFHTSIETAPALLQDADNTWYINIRVDYYSVINNFTNI